MKFRFSAVGTAIALAFSLSLFGGPSANAQPYIDDKETVWIYGDLIVAESAYCYSKRVKSLRLQIRDKRGKWRTVAKSTRKKSSACKKRTPFVHSYVFVLEYLGTSRIPQSRARLLELREVTSTGSKYPFTKQVYASKDDHVRDLGEAFCKLLGLPPGC